jgi:hypothetical protein
MILVCHHLPARRSDPQELVMLLLRFDACATVINGTAQIPKDVSDNAEIRSMLEGEWRFKQLIPSERVSHCSFSLAVQPGMTESGRSFLFYVQIESVSLLLILLQQQRKE